MAASFSERSSTPQAASVADTRASHAEQLRRAERFNGRAAMLGLVIGVVVEGLTGMGIAHQIGLGALVDGYAACRTSMLPFCF
ncbi:high light inducible protein [Synechococcus sp. RSCCF101]|uniref:chlorophyll a/b-binding protein n=1 Tax=Synechococcus sp. RSCCF101 TaxID=2511069 RepID=UPI00124842FA|nr:chlorophyll a/b-binding protein [Synechococcus sp. RSCCF101]QEY31265.1 high light inducible protein [Synechococcus sp. RSCCF101]